MKDGRRGRGLVCGDIFGGKLAIVLCFGDFCGWYVRL